MTTNGDLTNGDNPVSDVRPPYQGIGGRVPGVRLVGWNRFGVSINARRWLESRPYRLWGSFDLSDDKSFEKAVDWLECQVVGVLEAEREERAEEKVSPLLREADGTPGCNNGQWQYGRFNPEAH